MVPALLTNQPNYIRQSTVLPLDESVSLQSALAGPDCTLTLDNYCQCQLSIASITDYFFFPKQPTYVRRLSISRNSEPTGVYKWPLDQSYNTNQSDVYDCEWENRNGEKGEVGLLFYAT